MKKIFLTRLCALTLALLVALSACAWAETGAAAVPVFEELGMKSLDGEVVSNSTSIDDGDEVLLKSSSTSGSCNVGDSFSVDLYDGTATSWSSSNKKVAKVEDGTVECLKKGSAKITVKGYNDDDKSVKRTLKLSVKDDGSGSAKGVKIFFDDDDAGDTYYFKAGETWNTFPGWDATLQAEVTPDDADQDVTWSSSKSSIVEIDKYSGQLYAKKTGKAKITAKASNGKKQTVVISVKKYSASTNLSKSKWLDDAIDSGEPLVAVKSITVESIEKATVTFVFFNGTDSKISKIKNISATVTANDGFELSGDFSSAKVNCGRHSSKEFKLTFKKSMVDQSWPGTDKLEADVDMSFDY